ncbi:MAG: FG-GAP-like repeat-containing protein [Calothrix sp. MO_167.B12]|nr:FG-GAP-like repeat-containing protein [Calothrix sp. MO_167.B12]
MANPVLNVSGNTNYEVNTGPQILAPNLAITDSDGGNLDGAKVIITNKLSGDTLGVAGQTGTNGTVEGLTWSYDENTGILTLSGDADNSVYQNVLRQITYSNTSGTPDTTQRNIQFSLGSLARNPENGNFYEFVGSDQITWTTAKSAAEGKSYFERQGYLVTITSAGEQEFVQTNAGIGGNAWIGASDADTDGEWFWVTGPEAGTQFWSGKGNNGNEVGNQYSNWSDTEPNNLTNVNPNGEAYAHIQRSPLEGPLLNKWNDLPDTGPSVQNPNYSIKGYVVEYGGFPGESELNISGNVTVNITSDSSPSNPNPPDFNGDKKPEILWRNFNTGDNEIWGVNYDGNNTTQPFSINPIALEQFAGSNWKAEGIQDYNNDKIDDIFWHNSQTGENVIWIMTNGNNGIEVAQKVAIDPFPGSGWEIEDVADFTGDGIKEVLWRNNETDENTIWEIKFDNTNAAQPFSVDSTSLITPGDTNWKILDSGDFNNDGIADIVWHRNDTGENAIWLMKNDENGLSVDKGYFLNDLFDIDWKIEGVADFNKDGNDDILWRNYGNETNPDSGKNAIWLMRDESSLGDEVDGEPELTVTWQMRNNDGTLGPKREAGRGIFLVDVGDLKWDIEGVADFTGDNNPDILWRNYGTEENAIWRMGSDGNGVNLDGGFFIDNKPLPWQVESPTANNDPEPVSFPS